MIENSEPVQEISEMLKALGETIAVAESTTGGLISACLLAMPGASDYFLGGVVIYTRESRKLFLGASSDELKGVAPLSEEMALYFARRVKHKLGATWGLSELGIAGPTGSPYGFEAGNSVISIAGPVEATTRINTGHNDRMKNMAQFAEKACELLKNVLSEREKNKHN